MEDSSGVRWLRDRYHLTLAEATVAAQIAAGHLITRVAADRSVSVLTVRTQLRNIYRKTGVHRQAALVRLVLEAEQPAAPRALQKEHLRRR